MTEMRIERHEMPDARIRTSGVMIWEGKRGVAEWPSYRAHLRLYPTFLPKSRSPSTGKAGMPRLRRCQRLTRCTTPSISADEVRRYGYRWFIMDIDFGKPSGWAPGRLERMWFAQGEGGQRLFIIPALELVVAITAGNYSKEDQGIPPARILREIILQSNA